MSILTAIFQAVFQAITFIFPISENGHYSLFHNFAGITDATPAAITGVIHIGIAIGIIIAMYKLFLSLFNEFFFTFQDIFKKRLKSTPPKAARKFMYYTLLSFAPMILWLIPFGSRGFLFDFLRSSAYNGNLLDDGLFFLATGILVVLCAKQLKLSRNNKNINLIFALIAGFASIILVPVAGLSFIGGVFCILMLLGVSKKVSFRYSFVLSVPVLVVMGILEICASSEPAGIVSIIIGIILSAAVSFVCVRFFKWVINNDKLKFFGYYDFGIGVIAAVIGIFQLILN
ncbi:MAG: undecaprenyl-diphosphate phosphatase [Eubacterium sp.]|nr:undecaprenyl-diphosphate phosphatase [Eubacterium sp.]